MRKSALLLLGLLALGLLAAGLVVISTASQPNSIRLHHGDPYHFLVMQSAFAVGAIVFAAITALVDYRIWRNHFWLTVLGCIVIVGLLGAVFLGKKVNGSYRWVNLGAFNLQPAELAKLFTVLAVAAWLDLCGWKVAQFWKGFVLSGVIVAVFAGPVLFQPDFGSVMVIGVAGFLMMFLCGVRLLYLIVGGGLGALVVAYKVLNNGNRMARIAAWLPKGAYDWLMSLVGGGAVTVQDASAERAAYQAKQALVAIKNGGVWGVGMNESIQKQYYLPEAHTDFIFAVGCEERGLVFSLVVMLLFVAFFLVSVHIARHASDRYGRNIAFGVGFLIFFQAMFNIGVVCSALPTKGMALPFFSYGGTNLICAGIAVGLIFSVGIHSLRDKAHSAMRKVVKR